MKALDVQAPQDSVLSLHAHLSRDNAQPSSPAPEDKGELADLSNASADDEGAPFMLRSEVPQDGKRGHKLKTEQREMRCGRQLVLANRAAG